MSSHHGVPDRSLSPRTSRSVVRVAVCLALGVLFIPPGGAAEPDAADRDVRPGAVDVDVPAPRPLPLEDRFFRLPQFLRADANADGRLDISDAVATFRSLFRSGTPLPCLNAADADGNHRLELTDGIFSLQFLFRDGRPPPPPGHVECGVDRDPQALSCASYTHCPDDLPLITHVLNRITFGPTEELLGRIQTRAELIRYIDQQLAAPEDYDPALHDPELHAGIEGLEIGFDPEGTPGAQVERLKGMLIASAKVSDWPLLQVTAHFWNNHFHSQIDTLRQNFFGRGGRGGGATPATAEIFAAADADRSGTLVEPEWNAFRDLHPGALRWTDFGRVVRDGVLTLDEFLGRNVAGAWKYWRAQDQFGVAADMEMRDFSVYRRGAFGPFKNMLESCAKGVAMLIYLNGFENNVLAPNENYAREFLELQSCGADRMYTQRDIEELARVLTGWTVGWVERSAYDPADFSFQEHPESRTFPINLREPPPFRFPTTQFWDDGTYTWAFVLGGTGGRDRPLPDFGHDWERKDLFLQRYGGVDSLGNPVSPADEISIPANDSDRTVAAALREFDLVLDKVTGFRDCAKFISTKLIQRFVTDDLSRLSRTREMPAGLRTLFDAVDRDSNGAIDLREWEEPVPLALPNGRPPEIFAGLDVDGDGRITTVEYQEPDLLLDAIDAWQASDGNIREVLRTILHSDEFLSLKFYRAKVKDPFELVLSTVRALDGVFTGEQLLLTTVDLSLAGMELVSFADPTGESEFGFDWMHTIGLLERLKFVNRAANPLTTREGRLLWDPFALRTRWELVDAARTVDYFAQLLLNADLLDSQRQLALEVYRSTADPNRKISATAAYMMSLPQFQKQ